VALPNTLGKVPESTLARRICYVVERHRLLPGDRWGGRKGRSTELAIHVLLKRIYSAWDGQDRRVASALLLDVIKAFDYVSHTRLIHNLRKRRVDR
jgi:hypothetical protein